MGSKFVMSEHCEIKDCDHCSARDICDITRKKEFLGTVGAMATILGCIILIPIALAIAIVVLL